jgi:hypothetical protein
MIKRRTYAVAAVLLASTLICSCAGHRQSTGQTQSPGALATHTQAASDKPPPAADDNSQPGDPWPRTFKAGTATALVYQPQVDSWQGNLLALRAVVSVKPEGSDQEAFGVIWATARTQVDRATRMVALEDLVLTKSNFPTLPDRGALYMAGLQKELAATPRRLISLDRLKASLAAAGTAKSSTVPVNTDPPQILVSYSPALLVPIDGSPVLRSVADSDFARVINTHALIFKQRNNTYYLHLYDGWLSAGSIQGPWSQAEVLPPGIDQLAASLIKSGVVDPIDGGESTPKPSLANGVPTIYMSEKPAELIVFNGTPVFAPVAGTNLKWASNTASDVFIDSAQNDYYILLSGRWFRAQALAGPWHYVASTNLPQDFQHIPPDSPAAMVLVAVAGTPLAQEAAIENSIPQTAAVLRANGPHFTAVYDDVPQFRPIQGTPLQYAVNSPSPIIRVNAETYYALQAGVWFLSDSAVGPWHVATSVPTVIYTIPPTSPLHYVTYVHVYGSSSQEVYVGYTPGYMGTVVAPDGVVVYGTGYVYDPWIGTAWYPPPTTYGVMAQPIYNPAVGVTYGFAMGVATASTVYVSGGTPYYHPAYYGYPCCGSASANVYGQHGSTSYSGTRTAYDTSSGTYGTSTSGTYKNTATGTTGTFSGGRSYNPYTGQSEASASKTSNTPEGVSTSQQRSASYDAQTGTATRSGDASATGPEGRTTSAQAEQTANTSGQKSAESERTSTNANTGITKTSQTTSSTSSQGTSAEHQTTVTDTKTGQSKTTSSSAGTSGNSAYADHDGNVYKSSGSGWEKQTSSGSQSVSKPPSTVENEAQARSQGEEKYNNYKQSGSSGESERSSGFGESSEGSHESSASHYSGGSGGGRFRR